MEILELTQSPTDMKIFLVDDDILNLKVTMFHLKRIGFKHVTTFENGLECLKHLDVSSKPDIIFLDQYMGGIDGVDVLKKVKQLHPEVIVVMLSAEDSERSALCFKALGAFEYIVKGNDAMDKIQEVLSKITISHS